MSWNKPFPSKEITEGISEATVEYAQAFGYYLGTNTEAIGKNGRPFTTESKLTTSQLRKFFGEVKRQQMQGFSKSDFILLKPKLAYAVGRADKNSKIYDFYKVMSVAMDQVNDERTFINFIKVFEAIVAFHKATEAGQNLTNR